MEVRAEADAAVVAVVAVAEDVDAEVDEVADEAGLTMARV